MIDWQPNAEIDTLRKRAAFIANIRTFFNQRQVMEVETPLLSQGTVTDVYLDAFETNFPHHQSGQSIPLYLQTSPEFAMKRLLAAGSGAIFQICKAFRNEAAGRLHNPEFTMLEWYRPGFDDIALMNELDELVQMLLGTAPSLKLTYQQAFKQFIGIDPLVADLSEIKRVVAQYSQDDWLQQESNKENLLQWLFCMEIEPKLGITEDSVLPCFIYHFPAAQASLAKISNEDNRVAHRFELYFKGIELANGFYELQDAMEQSLRFDNDNRARNGLNLAQKPKDLRLIAALEQGLPDCAGVALGIDRLFMLHLGVTDISATLSFDANRC